MMQTAEENSRIRSFAQTLASEDNRPVTLVQGIVTGFGIGELEVLMRGQSDTGVENFPVGGIRFFDSYRPKIGDTVWLVKQGGNVICIGDLTNPVPEPLEPWKYVALTEDDVPFETGYENLGFSNGATYCEARFYKDPDGWVHLDGAVHKPGGGTTLGVIFTLPEGYRPRTQMRFAVAVCANNILATGTWECVVQTNGRVFMLDQGTKPTNINSWINLSGVRFMAAEVGNEDPLSRDNEWQPFHMYENWTWDQGLDMWIPPAEWIRWDGLVRLRGMLSNGPVPGPLCTPSERARRRRYTALLRSINDNSSTAVTSVRLDMKPMNGYLTQMSTTYTNGICLDGIQWYSDIPESYWSDLDLGASWVPYNSPRKSGEYAPPQFFRNAYNEVHLRGLIKGGTTTMDQPIAWLPEGYRPDARLMFYTTAANGTSRFDILPTGAIHPMDGLMNNAFLSLDSASFRASDLAA